MFDAQICIGSMSCYISDVIGLVGVFLVLWSYLWLQLNRWAPDDLIYSATNFIGSIFIVISLLHTWNLASFVIEVAWLAISAYGIYKFYFKPHNKEHKDGRDH